MSRLIRSFTDLRARNNAGEDVDFGAFADKFASEEPGTAADIKAFYVDAHKLPAASLMERVDVNGANTHEVYKFLKGTPELGEKIEWNFTKFVVGRDGQVLGRYPQRTKPKDFDKMFAEMFAQAES